MGEIIYPKRLSSTVKKTYSLAALTVLTGLLLSGCSGAPASTPSSDSVPSAAATKTTTSVPTPNPAQEASLLAEFKKIAPGLDNPRNIQEAQQGCRVILRGSPEVAQLSVAKRILRNSNAATDPNSDEKAKQIIAAIKSNGFCKTAP